MIVILDYGMGNLGAHLNMMRKIGYADVIISSGPEDLKKARKIIIPGVGAFDTGMKNLKKLGLIEILNYKALEEKIPVLGICLGMHLFAERSEEGNEDGLGWINTKIVRFDFKNRNISLKIPHMGWNTISISGESPVFRGMENDENRFYFVHSYHIDNIPSDFTIATTNYGYEFPSIIQRGNIIGAQFHPEKSHNFGIKFYRNFISI